MVFLPVHENAETTKRKMENKIKEPMKMSKLGLLLIWQSFYVLINVIVGIACDLVTRRTVLLGDWSPALAKQI